MSSGPTPASLERRPGGVATLTLDGVLGPGWPGLNTSKEPKPRVRVAPRAVAPAGASRSAAAWQATMIAAPPSPGEQNMYWVSGSLTISAAAMAPR